MNKKGSSVIDLLFIAVVFLILAITAVVGYKILSDFNAEVQGDDSFSEEAKAVAGANKTNFLNVFDAFFLYGIIFLGLGLIVGATLLNTHPYFFLGSVVLLAVLVFMAGTLSNTYEEFVADSSLSAEADDFTVLPFVFANYPKILVGLGILLIVGLFSKLRGGTDGL